MQPDDLSTGRITANRGGLSREKTSSESPAAAIKQFISIDVLAFAFSRRKLHERLRLTRNFH